MPSLADITIPLTEIEVATLVHVGGIFARRLAYQRDRLLDEVRLLKEYNAVIIKQLREDNTVTLKRWTDFARGQQREEDSIRKLNEYFG